MLKAHITELAKYSYNAALNQRRVQFGNTLARLAAELASKGIVGGPTIALISEAAVTEISERKALAAHELRRAALSAGVRYYPNLPADLDNALKEMLDGSMRDVVALGRERVRHLANPVAAQQTYEASVVIHIAGFALQSADLAHFAESLKTERRKNALGLGWKITIPITVAVLLWIGSRLPDWVASISRMISSSTGQLLHQHP